MAAGSTRAEHKAFLLCNYTLMGAASVCIFLTLSLRLRPSECGLLFLLLQAHTAVFAAEGCSGSFTEGEGVGRAHATRTAGAFYYTAISQGDAEGCSGSFTEGEGAGRAHATRTALAFITIISQGVFALFAFTRTADFLAELGSYVREEDGEVILKLVGGLCAAMFVLQLAECVLGVRDNCGEEVDGEHCKSWASGYHVCDSGILL